MEVIVFRSAVKQRASYAYACIDFLRALTVSTGVEMSIENSIVSPM